MPKVVVIIQARMGSTRLPGKVLLPLAGKTVLQWVIDRAREAESIDEVIVATTTEKKDDPLVSYLAALPTPPTIFRGSETDVLDRYYQAAKKARADVVVRVTSDNPLVDPEVIDAMVGRLEKNKLDYISNNIGQHTFPRGLDTEAIRFSVLETLWKTTTEPIDREHVTIYIKRFPDKFIWETFLASADYSRYRLTVDEARDYEAVQRIMETLAKTKPNFRLADIIQFLENHPEIVAINADVEQQNAKY